MFFDPILIQDLSRQAHQIKQEVVGPARSEKIFDLIWVPMSQVLANGLIDFVATAPSRGPDCGNQGHRIRQATSNGLQTDLDDSGRQTTPTRVNRPNDTAVRSRNQDRNAIGCDDSEADPRLGAENDIGLRPLRGRVGRLCLEDLDSMNLFRKDSEIRELATTLTESMFDSASNENGVA